MVGWDGRVGSRQFEFGYHEVEIEGQPVFVISAPVKAYFPGDPENLGNVEAARNSPPFQGGEAAKRSGWFANTRPNSLLNHPGASRHPSLERRGVFPSSKS